MIFNTNYEVLNFYFFKYFGIVWGITFGLLFAMCVAGIFVGLVNLISGGNHK